MLGGSYEDSQKRKAAIIAVASISLVCSVFVVASIVYRAVSSKAARGFIQSR